MSENLNQEQQNAANHSKGALLVVAGAGTGKTSTLTHRIANLIANGAQPWQILAVTFTNKAAAEMHERVQKLLDDDLEDQPWIGTFHRLGAYLVRRHYKELGFERSPIILDQADVQASVKQILKSAKLEPKHARAFINKISLAQNAMISAEAMSSAANTEEEAKIAKIYREYNAYKKRSQAIDFDDLLTLPLKLFKNNQEIKERYQKRWQYIMIDEYQDTNLVQDQLATLLAEAHGNICAIGDGDQSIYAFRGADVGNILEFPKKWQDCEVITLRTNYRSTPNILAAANALISNNQNRIPKEMISNQTEGKKPEVNQFFNDREEAKHLIQSIQHLNNLGRNYRDCAILVRTTAQTRIIEEALLQVGIPYQLIGGIKFYGRREIKDVLAYLRFIINPDDEVSCLRVINTPPRKIGAATIVKLQNHALTNDLTLGRVIEHAAMLEGLSPTARKALTAWQEQINHFRQQWQELTPRELAESIIENFNLEKYYNDGTPKGEACLENLQELLNVMAKMDNAETTTALPLLLEEISLLTDGDKLSKSSDQVKIMTIHAAKGLEFDNVFLPGLEEGLLPHQMSAMDPFQLEEERRLMYVAMTRARRRLHISHANERWQAGELKRAVASRFLREMNTSL